MSEWQPIETAPKDGEIIIILSMGHVDDYPTSVATAFWGPRDSWVDSPDQAWCNWNEGLDDDDFWAIIPNPTHWMPLPEPPSA